MRAPLGVVTQTRLPLRMPRGRGGRVDLDEHLLLQLGQPGVGARLLAAALVLDQTARGHDERELLVQPVLDVLCCSDLKRMGRRQRFFWSSWVGYFSDQVGPGAEDGLAVLRDRIGKFQTTARALALPKGGSRGSA